MGGCGWTGVRGGRCRSVTFPPVPYTEGPRVLPLCLDLPYPWVPRSEAFPFAGVAGVSFLSETTVGGDRFDVGGPVSRGPDRREVRPRLSVGPTPVPLRSRGECPFRGTHEGTSPDT